MEATKVKVVKGKERLSTNVTKTVDSNDTNVNVEVLP